MTPKICVVTVSRGEWGYLRPILSELNERNIDFELFVTNMHLQPENGESWREIVQDGFNIAEKIPLKLDGIEQVSWPSSLGGLISILPKLFFDYEIELLSVAGDRAETLASVLAAYYSNIPIAHIQAGERSGSKDDMARHAIARLATIHFSSNEDATKRLINSGEEEHRAFEVGAPQLDDMVRDEPHLNLNNLKNQWLREFVASKAPFALCVYHPTIEDLEMQNDIVERISLGVSKFGLNQIWLYPNNDLGSREVANQIDQLRSKSIFRARNLNRRDYLSLLKFSEVIIGNSSSGIIEASIFRTPTINIGSRQNARLQPKSVFNVKPNLVDLDPKLGLALDFKKVSLRPGNEPLWGWLLFSSYG